MAPGAVALRKESVDRNIPAHIIRTFTLVALRKESVDRNDNYNLHCVEEVSSLSARRAWIEMPISRGFFGGWKGRSPQGERG